MKQSAANNYRTNRKGPIPSAAAEQLTVTKAADAVTTPAIVAMSGLEDNASVLSAFSVVGELDVIADSVVAPATECSVENLVIFNCDTTDHTFTVTYATLTGPCFTVTVKAGDIWSWADGYEETSVLTENNQ